MQNVPATDLITVLNKYNSTLHGGASLKFNPQADNETSFGNYSERGLLGRVAAIVRTACSLQFSIYANLIT
jgi:hypothetical protein